MNIPKIGSIINTTAKRLTGKASSNIPKEAFIIMQKKADFEAALARDCAKIYLMEKYPAVKQREALCRNLPLKVFADNAKTAASELLNASAKKLSGFFKK